MGNKKRKLNSAEKVPRVKKTRQSKKTIKEDESKDLFRDSLPVLSDEKLCYYDDPVRFSEDSKLDDKVLKIVLPKIKIRCEPLNVEKIIDLGNNGNVTDVVKKVKKKPGKKSEIDLEQPKPLKSQPSKKLVKVKEKSFKAQPLKKIRSTKKELKEFKKTEVFNSLAISSLKNSETNNTVRKKVKILINGSQVTFEDESISYNSTQIQEKNSHARTVQSFENQSSSNLNINTLNTKEVSYSSLCNLDDESALIELNGINLEELAPSLETLCDEEFKMKLGECADDRNTNIGEVSGYLLNENENIKSINSGDKSQNNYESGSYKQNTLQVVVEAFMKNPQLNYLKENTALKKGLCFTWLSNNYMCSSEQCLYSHDALSLFTKKLKQYPSKFIMIVVISMRNDILFVDVIMAAFKILSERRVPTIWVTFLIYFVHYVTEPSDSRFLKFWVNAARFFCQLDRNYAAANGFASLLSIFSHGEKSEEWKIIEFIKLIKQPPVQVSTTYALLQPVLKMNIPTELLTEAIESCIQTKLSFLRELLFAGAIYEITRSWSSRKEHNRRVISYLAASVLTHFSNTITNKWEKVDLISVKYAISGVPQFWEDLLKVYSIIIPKISFMTSPIQVIELLLKFCKTLEDEDLKIFSDDLKRRLRPKVLSFRTKITQREYPLTAFFQEELSRNLTENSLISALTITEEKSESDLAIVGLDNNYFEIEEDFYNILTETIKFSPDSIPSPFRNAVQTDKAVELFDKHEVKEENICERQITRIKQFFQDCQFDLLGKYLNELRSNVIERATEVIIKLLFLMKISLQQVVDLIKIIVLPCKSENAAKIIASVSLTLILNLVRINEWEKAHVIVSLCKEKEINLLTGKPFYLKELNNVTQCRIALLLIEIYAYKSDYISAVALVKQHSLFSCDHSLWQVTWKPHDEIIRVSILKDLLRQIICSQMTKAAYDLFEIIWKAQNQLCGSVDLGKYVNEILILLLNEGNEKAVNLYEKLKTEVQLNDMTARAILVTLVRQNRLSAAKSLFLSQSQSVYFLPEIRFGSADVTILSVWLEEEIYVMFDALFDLLVTETQSSVLTNYDDLEVNIEILKPKNVASSGTRPLCLGIIKPTFKDACCRIQRVLQYQFNPPLKLITKLSCLKLEKYTLKLHLERRINRNSC